MKVLIVDNDGVGLAFALRCKDAGHSVRLWTGGDESLVGTGLVEKPREWKPSMDWADLIVLTDNAKGRLALRPYFKQGYPIFGANDEGAELELDRTLGQEVLEDCGIECLPYMEFHNFDDAIRYVKKTDKPYAIKPWGGETDKALSFVSNTPDDAIFVLTRWKADGLKGDFILQEKADGIEMGVAAWFGPAGWSSEIEESWEEKKLMNDGLGCNTGEMGTTIRLTKHSAMFNRLLQPLTEYLLEAKYVGDLSINCIVDKKTGTPWPLEITARLGWPDFNIRTALHEGDPAEWMLDLVEGYDTLKFREGIAVGVVNAHGDFPHAYMKQEEVAGYPIRGITPENLPHVAFQSVMWGKPEGLKEETYLTSNKYVLVTVGTGNTVREAAQQAYDVAWEIDIGGSDRMMRTDISKRLKKELPVLQDLGYAIGLEY